MLRRVAFSGIRVANVDIVTAGFVRFSLPTPHATTVRRFGCACANGVDGAANSNGRSTTSTSDREVSRFVLWGQDTHGNARVIGRYTRREDAEAKLDELEAHVHKQHYWVFPTSSLSGGNE